VRVVRVACLKGRYSLKLSAMPGIARQLRRRKGAVVHAHDATGGYAAAMCADSRRLVYTMHGVGFHEKDWPTPFRQGIRMMQRTVVRRAAKVFCTDPKAMEAVKGLGRSAELLSSGIDVDDFDRSSLARPKEYDPDKFIILFVGRLTGVKGIETLLDAIDRIDSQKRAQARFVLIGEGPLSDVVAAASSRIPQMLQLGPIDHSRIAPYFAHADAFVLPSLSEGLPISLLEAMASGLPCVASRVGGIESGMPPEVLRLVAPGDSKELAEALVWLTTERHAAKLLGNAGREHVERNYSWDSVVDRLVETYKELARA
jgi:glycosyltransferase involved in cell wall biosynthesis